MTDDGFGVSVGVVGIGVDGPFLPQVTETVFTEPVVIAQRQISAQCVDGDLQDKTGCNGGCQHLI
jgi:hypothetical protein